MVSITKNTSMGRFEMVSDFIINDSLKPHANSNFRVASPGKPLLCHKTDTAVHPKIITSGSGNSIQEPPIFAKLLAMSGKDQPNVVYIGTPFFDREDKYELGTASFRHNGCPIKRLMVAKEDTTPSDEEMRRILVEWADVVMVSGGNSLFAMLRWQSIGLDLLLREAALKGAVLCGGSAGCGVWFDSMQTDSLKPEACKQGERALAELSAEERLDWSFLRISCMGFINAFCVPHLDTVGTNNVARVDIAKKMLLDAALDPNSTESPIYGLGVDEKAAVVYEGGKVTIMSAGNKQTGVGQATCHVLFVNDRHEVMCIPVTPNTGEAVSLDELIERAKRSVEAVQSPLDLMVSRDVTNACHRRGCSGNIDMMSVVDAAIVDAAGFSSVTTVATMGALERPLSIHNLGRPPSVPIDDACPNPSPHATPSPLRALETISPLCPHARSQSVGGLVSNIEGHGLPSLNEGKRLVAG